MKKLTKITKFESGQILILVALMMVGLLGVTALIIDVGERILQEHNYRVLLMQQL